MNSNNDLAIRSSGEALFTVTLDGSTVEVFDWIHWSKEQGLDEASKNALLEQLLVSGSAEVDGAAIELLNGQELTQQISA